MVLQRMLELPLVLPQTWAVSVLDLPSVSPQAWAASVLELRSVFPRALDASVQGDLSVLELRQYLERQNGSAVHRALGYLTTISRECFSDQVWLRTQIVYPLCETVSLEEV